MKLWDSNIMCRASPWESYWTPVREAISMLSTWTCPPLVWNSRHCEYVRFILKWPFYFKKPCTFGALRTELGASQSISSHLETLRNISLVEIRQFGRGNTSGVCYYFRPVILKLTLTIWTSSHLNFAPIRTRNQSPLVKVGYLQWVLHHEPTLRTVHPRWRDDIHHGKRLSLGLEWLSLRRGWF